ncbi:MAG: hypothetical protein ABSC25_11185 [Roseiarcus sp.]|jgi:preprotein translocase subunit SecY
MPALTDALLLKPARLRIVTLVGMALVYALATQVPLPGLVPDFLANGWSAPWMTRLSVAALGVTPFVSAILLFEIARLAAPPLARWAASPANAGRCETIVWALALVVAALQGFAIARGIEAAPGPVVEPGAAFRLVCIATTLGATAIFGALARFIRRAGAGDGFLILFAVPMLSAMVHLAETAWRGPRPAIDVAVIVIATALLVAGALASPRARPGALGFGGGALDPLPPLIGLTFAGFSSAASLAWGASALEGAAGTIAMAAVGAAAIALAAAMRANLPGAPERGRVPWPATLATIAVAAGLPLLQLAAPSLVLPTGYSVVFVVAAALSVLEALRPAERRLGPAVPPSV